MRQRQTAETAYFSSKQLLLFVFVACCHNERGDCHHVTETLMTFSIVLSESKKYSK